MRTKLLTGTAAVVAAAAGMFGGMQLQAHHDHGDVLDGRAASYCFDKTAAAPSAGAVWNCMTDALDATATLER